MSAACCRKHILDQLLASLPPSTYWRRRIREAISRDALSPTLHLAVMVEPYLSAILSGRKTIESRFSVNRCAPYLGVQPGDIILFKRSAGPVSAISCVRDVRYYELSPDVLRAIRSEYSTMLCAVDDEFWHARSNKQFATLIEVEQTLEIDPFPIAKRDRRGWVTYPSEMGARQAA